VEVFHRVFQHAPFCVFKVFCAKEEGLGTVQWEWDTVLREMLDFFNPTKTSFVLYAPGDGT